MTSVFRNLPAVLLPQCATRSASRKPTFTSSQSANVVLLAVCLRMFLRWPKTDKERLFHVVLYDSIFVQCLAMCLLSSRFYPWYLGMVFPLALLLNDDSKLRSFCIAATCFLLFSLLWLGFSNPSLNLIYLSASLAVSFLKPFSEERSPASQV